MQSLPTNMFHGKPCRTCGGTIRYVTAKSCVVCKRAACLEWKKANQGYPKRKPWVADSSINIKTKQPTLSGRPCTRCGFAVRFARTGQCVRCEKQWRRDNEKDKRFSSALYRQLGVTPESYFQLCEAQNWSCLICEEVAKKTMHLDHCHKTMKVRGLLCGSCNRAIGLFRDDAKRLQKAIEYLRSC